MLGFMRRMPRLAGMLVWALGAVAMHAVVPFELARLGDRAGRPAARSRAMQGMGLVTVAAGAGLMAWALAAHGGAAPRGWPLGSGLTPPYLLRRGPYRLSRNPMYTGESAVWLGWALFYRRPAVWAGLAVQCAAFTLIVRWEEQRLLGRFGSDYRAYVAEVPRWVPRSVPRPRLQPASRADMRPCSWSQTSAEGARSGV
jgi:protein-S-isoprenylcysteine O-methyltransferase Ste14